MKSRVSSAKPKLRDKRNTLNQSHGNLSKLLEKVPKMNLSMSTSKLPSLESLTSPTRYKIDDLSNRILNEKVELNEFLETEK